jgi:7-cyano-7-deazaguanine synthase
MSGGPDSATLLAEVLTSGEKVLALHFSTGLSANSKELEASKNIAAVMGVPLQVLDISHFVAVGGNKEPTIHSEAHSLEFGTAALLSMAAAIAIANLIKKVYIALHADDATESVEYSPAFIDHINSGIKLIGAPCEIVAPFQGLTKRQVIGKAKALQVKLELSWSCVSPINGKQCGTCGACRARRSALQSEGVPDATVYHVP